MSEIIKKLPTVFQTTTEKKFFDATFDQVFSKKDTEYLAGYLGRKEAGKYNPASDFYIPEPSKNRTWWQLEPTAYSRDENYNKSNIFFYEDLLNRIDYYGGNTYNQNRLFSGEYYSWAPPIDFDMFVNYQNYYWLDKELPVIALYGVSLEEILGATQFLVPGTDDFYLSAGMLVTLPDSEQYQSPHYVEFVNGVITLIKRYENLATNGSQMLPWDGIISAGGGLEIINKEWDAKAWEIEDRLGDADYITIARGSISQNAWSRGNRWVHIDTIRQVMAYTNTAWPTSAIRAARPIIQYDADLELYKSGTQFRADVKYGFINGPDGLPLTLNDMQMKSRDYLNLKYSVELNSGDRVVFLKDTDVFTLTDQFWETFNWDDSLSEFSPHRWGMGQETRISNFIFRVTQLPTGEIFFVPDPSWAEPVQDGDIIFTNENTPNGAGAGESWYYDPDIGWVYAFNNRTNSTAAIWFQLYDHEGVKLDDSAKYPDSSFRGSKIFSYKINSAPGASVDPILGFPILYNTSGQSSDIMFENNLITDRYVYGVELNDITGYYYYKVTGDPVLHNNWELYTVETRDVGYYSLPRTRTSKQRVIDKFAVKKESNYQFKLSVLPAILDESYDVIVSVNGNVLSNDQYYFEVINNRIYVNLNQYLSTKIFNQAVSVPPVVELSTFTNDYLHQAEYGYSEIPQQLEANPGQLEVGEISGSNLVQHFSSIIQNQVGFKGDAFGGTNNYRNTAKNKSLGKYILQNITPALKSMLVSSDADLDLVNSIRYSQDEYTKFKNRYVSTAYTLIKQQFDPVQYFNNTVIIGQWVDEILKVINVSKEFSKSFAYSHMVANGTPAFIETKVVDSVDVSCDFYINLADEKNALYIYDNADNERLLLVDIDYQIVSINNLIEIRLLDSSLVGKEISIVFFQNSPPAYIPATPTKIGAYSVYVPRIETDYSYAVPASVIIGHDGSRTIAYGDYRDQLLLELEKRIYNSLKSRFRSAQVLPLRIENVRSGFFRQTEYSYAEYLEIAEQYLNKWCARNRANYRSNDWQYLKDEVPATELWKLYNYSMAEDINGNKLNLPGHWKGIFTYLYDTCYPDTKPWEMLGFSYMPDWWTAVYGNGVTNSNGQTVWTNPLLWQDLEQGVIRAGTSAIINPYNNQVLPNRLWARPGLSQFMPINSAGEIRTIAEIFNLAITENAYEPFDGYNNEWKFGDGAPVEQAWQATSSYVYSLQEILFLTKPAAYAEFFWDTFGTDYSIGRIPHPENIGNDPVTSYFNYQYVQNGVYTADDQLFNWMRPKNSNQIVHSEQIDGVAQVRYGYQQWIADRILFHGKDITSTFGVKIRNLDVNLANKFAGFTNKDTVNTYIESVSLLSSSRTLGVPSSDFGVFLHKGQPLNSYSYSGVIIRALADGTFAVYGYDLLNSQFVVLDRSDRKQIDVTIGGTPAEFQYFVAGTAYQQGTIVRYNGIYYSAKETHVAVKFDTSVWVKLPALPIVGGVSVSYKPESLDTVTRYAYGTVFKSAQEVFDFLIGWGAYLEQQGWKFEDTNAETNQVSNWFYSAKQFLFWLNSSWAPNATIQLSPLANKATLQVERGYPNDVELISNGVYSILDKQGVAIPVDKTVTERDGKLITVKPIDLAAGGIYFLHVNSSESEHVILFDNSTSFGDTIYSPLLRSRQDRIRFNGFRSKNWYGKMEAAGYLIIDNQLVPNYDTLVSDIRHYYDPDNIIDNPNAEELGRRLIGFESKTYMNNLQITDDTQYLFYQGAIRQKGTEQSLNKLFRSSVVNTDETVTVYEEWALKSATLGNTIDRVSTEFILHPEQFTGDTMVAKLNFVPSDIGIVKKIEIVNSINRYKTVPRIEISAPDTDPLENKKVSKFDPGIKYQVGDIVFNTDQTGETAYYRSNILQTPSEFVVSNWEKIQTIRPARAYAVLDKSGRISRVDISDHGYGYSSAPTVSIVTDEQITVVDQLYAVWQGESIGDAKSDNIISVDIDDSDLWVSRPLEAGNSLVFPTTDRTEYDMPNAGYVNLADVTWSSFDIASTVLDWGTEEFNPSAYETLWVANTFTGDWGVYKLVPYTLEWRVVKDNSGTLLLITNSDEFIGVQDSGRRYRSDLGNLICLQKADGNRADVNYNYTVAFDPQVSTYLDPDTGIPYNAYTIVNLGNVPITASDIGTYDEFNTLLLFRSLRWNKMPGAYRIPTYVGINDYIWVDDVNGKWAVYHVDFDPGIWDSIMWDQPIGQYYGTFGADQSVHAYGWDTSGPVRLTVHREQEPMIDTFLFDNARVFAGKSGNTLIQLPVYDPFKGILPGIARQNITYMTMADPARYNVTVDPKLYTESVTFLDNQIGKLWWDLSTVKYMYYEQPAAQGGNESVLDNLKYRRDNWGRLFPGSSVDIYEWVKSPVTPAEYTGPGTPKSTENFIQVPSTNIYNGIVSNAYYFWVKNSTVKPGIDNRTLTAQQVATMLQSPRIQGYSFFSPIQQASGTNSYMFYNVQDILSNKGRNVRVEYKKSERDDQRHVQWSLFREGDISSDVKDVYWDKFVDSICGYTAPIAVDRPFKSAIKINNQYIQPVPDPTLSEYEKYGISQRPAQTMFVDLQQARKVLVQSLNDLLRAIPARDKRSGWDLGLTQQYWKYVTWFRPGYENAKPTKTRNTLADAYVSLLNNELVNGDIVEVLQTNLLDNTTRYALYVVTPINGVQGFEEIAIQDSAVSLLDTVYTTRDRYDLAVELRALLTALKDRVFVDDYYINRNRLFAAMLNFVLSEQKTPDWIFKTSLITIKEGTVKLTQDRLYIPNQVEDIIDYVVDSKPYHTHVRDYTTVYGLQDTANLSANDSLKSKIVLDFRPGVSIFTPDNWDMFAWDTYGWEKVHDEKVFNQVQINAQTYTSGFGTNPLLTTPVDGFLTRDDVYRIPVLNFDPDKIGYSSLYPYTFDLSQAEVPAVFVPSDIIGVIKDDTVLYQGQDFFVSANEDRSYTIYLYNDPAGSQLSAVVWINGGSLLTVTHPVYRSEYAFGYPVDNSMMIVDTKLPVALVDGVYTPLIGWGAYWSSVDPDSTLSKEIKQANGITGPHDYQDPTDPTNLHWDNGIDPTTTEIVLLDTTACSRQTLVVGDGERFYRNSHKTTGLLVDTLDAQTADNMHIQTVRVFVDPATHPDGTDILPTPGTLPGAIWIEGERIEYRQKVSLGNNTWELSLLRRGTLNTSAAEHSVVNVGDFPKLVDVRVEQGNKLLPNSGQVAWNSMSNNVEPLAGSETAPLQYSRISNHSLFGIWYAGTTQAQFITDEPCSGPSY